MRFFRYKKVCKLHFFGYDDELNNDEKAYYNTPFKIIQENEINTKLLRFRIENLHNIKLSQHAKLSLESIFVPTIFTDLLVPKHFSNISVRFKNLNDSDVFDSSYNNDNSSTLIFSHSINAKTQIYTDPVTNDIANILNYDNGVSFHNTATDKLYTFSIPPNFTNNSVFEFELIYLMALDNVATPALGPNVYHYIDRATDRGDFYKFQCSLVVYDVEEEELLSSTGNIVDYDRMGPTAPAKRW